MKEEPSSWRTRCPCMTTALSSYRYMFCSPRWIVSHSLLRWFRFTPSNSLFCRDKELKRTSQKLSCSCRKQWTRFEWDTFITPRWTNCYCGTFLLLVSPPAGFCSRHQCTRVVLWAVRAGLQARGGAVGASRPPPESRCCPESGRRALAGSLSGESCRPGTFTCSLTRCQAFSKHLWANNLSVWQFTAYKYYVKAAERGHIRGAISLAEVWTTGIPGLVGRHPADAVL